MPAAGSAAAPAPARTSTTAAVPARSPAGASPAEPPPQLSPEEAQRRAGLVIRQSVAFAQIVTLLLRSPNYRHYALADLEWLVLPPLATGQFSIAEGRAQPGGPAFPLAAALWARVSAEVDQRLSANPGAPVRLRPDEWASGDILWLVDALGEPKIVSGLLKQLGDTVFKGRPLKIRTRGADGQPEVKAVVGGA